MEAESRDATSALTRLLVERGSEFELFQAIRLLHRLLPGRSRIGEFNAPATEAIRFRTDMSLACPPSLVRAISPLPEGSGAGPVLLTTAGFQLTGYSGVLPYFYSRVLAGAGHAYLDTLVHRLLSLQYRAWAKHRPHIALESGIDATRQRAMRRVLALLGAASPTNNDAESQRLAVHYANIQLGAPRSSVGLQQMLEDLCAVAVQIEQFLPKRVPVADDDRARLGTGRTRRRLDDGVLGGRMWQAGASFRIVLGPMSNRAYQRLMPGGPAFRQVVAVVRRFVGPAAGEFDLELRLRKAEAMPARIAARADCPQGEVANPVPSIQTQIGRYGWIGEATRRRPHSAASASDPVETGYYAAVFRCDDAADVTPAWRRAS